MKTFNLEERLIKFSVKIIQLVDGVKKSRAGNHLSGQLIRSGTSCALNYGEAQGSESTKDFIHKLKIILKELRESHICLRIIEEARLHSDNSELINVKKENNELIAIFVASISTSQKKG